MNETDVFGYMEFCPDAKGVCIGQACGAFTRGLTLVAPDGSDFVLQRLGINIGVVVPMVFSLDVFFCIKYRKLIGEESAKLYLSFVQEVMMPASKEYKED